MKSLYTNPEAPLLKSIFITDTACICANKEFSNSEHLLEQFENKGKDSSLLFVDFQLKDIRKIVATESNLRMMFFYRKESRMPLDFKTKANYDSALIAFLRPQQFTRAEEVKGNFLKHVNDFAYPLMAMLFTIAACIVAGDLEQGGAVRISGSKQGLKTILIEIADLLGVVGTALVGGLLTIYLVRRAYRIYQNSKQKMIIHTAV